MQRDERKLGKRIEKEQERKGRKRNMKGKVKTGRKKEIWRGKGREWEMKKE